MAEPWWSRAIAGHAWTDRPDSLGGRCMHRVSHATDQRAAQQGGLRGCGKTSTTSADVRRSATAGRRAPRPARPGSSARPARSAAYVAPSAGLASASPLLGQKAIARSAWAVIVSDGFTPEVGRDRRAVDDVEPRVAVHPLVGVDHAGLGRVADRAAADEVRGQRPLERLPDRCRRACSPFITFGHPAYGVVGDRDVGRVGLAVALHAATSASRSGRLTPHGGDRVVQRLHDQRDHRALATSACRS